ncbi:hypothetical protein ACWF50_11490 [Brucella pseudogrignonensis]
MPSFSMTEATHFPMKADIVEHVTRMVAGYLGTAPLPIRTILQEAA